MAEERLEAFRAAALSREWTILQRTLTALFGEIGVFPSVEIVITLLREYLPTFERYHPDDKIMRELLVSIVSFGFAPERLPEQIIGEYPTPGNGQFANAVLELCRAMQPNREPAERIGFLTSAAANSILARMTEDWYRRNPEAYARVRANRYDPAIGDYTDPDAAKIPILMWMDDDVAAIDTGGWLRLADAIGAKLGE